MKAYSSKEYKLVSLRDCMLDDKARLIDTPGAAADYWRTFVLGNPYVNPDVENFVVLYLNTRRKISGHHHVSTGTLDTILVHPREVFRVACVVNAAAVVLMHNHPSGDPTPSEADIKVTRDLIRAGQLLKIDVLDHVIIGCVSAERPTGYSSLRELGYFYT